MLNSLGQSGLGKRQESLSVLGSILFVDEQGRQAFRDRVQRMLNEGEGGEALTLAMDLRRDPRVDDGFALPDP